MLAVDTHLLWRRGPASIALPLDEVGCVLGVFKVMTAHGDVVRFRNVQ